MCAWLSCRPKYSHKVKCIVSEWCQSIVPHVMKMLQFFDEFFINKFVCQQDDPRPADRSKQLIQSANGSIPSSFSQSTTVQRSRSGKSTRCAPEGGGVAVEPVKSHPGAAIKKMTYTTSMKC